ncbi:MAG TPA: farnesyl diphosphate synthase [Tepidisphaeraceae bacterium]|jgi:geranylgeranyl diphosphate synthase type II|nr:farnesyl diphosphate synthase [Tepidisphaeraceae bacterium]
MDQASATSTDSATGILRQDGEAVDAYLRQVLARQTNAPKRLIESIEYSLMAGGKRLRPTLVLESFRACGGDEAHRATALAAAGAMELIHTFSLVHDDLPAMDDDDLRRGRPTNHKVFGEAMAILAGDAMMTLAFEILASDADASLVPQLVRELAHAAGPAGMIGGQVLDMAGEHRTLSLEELQQIHRMKTGALLTASCRMGAIAARADEKKLASVTEFGRHLGIAFQIVDDVLDETATPEQMGKATKKDSAKGKNTYPKLMGLESSRSEAGSHLFAGLGALGRFTDAADGLRLLARFIVERTK